MILISISFTLFILLFCAGIYVSISQLRKAERSILVRRANLIERHRIEIIDLQQEIAVLNEKYIAERQAFELYRQASSDREQSRLDEIRIQVRQEVLETVRRYDRESTHRTVARLVNIRDRISYSADKFSLSTPSVLDTVIGSAIGGFFPGLGMLNYIGVLRQIRDLREIERNELIRWLNEAIEIVSSFEKTITERRIP